MPTRSLVPTRSPLEKLRDAVLTPIKAMRLAYLPLLMVYFAYGALGITAIADSFFVKKSLTLSATDLAALGAWLTLPWTIKMVFGELVDAVPILGSQRRVYVFIGAGMIALGLLLLAALAAGDARFAPPNVVYALASLLIVLGTVVQDVVADAMSTEVVPRTHPDGTPRPREDIERDLGMVQLLGRLALSLGAFLVAYLSGWLAQHLPYSTVFMVALVVPAISVTGAVLVKLETTETRPIDWTILGGGLVFGLVVTLIGLSGIVGGQEIVFLVSMGVVIFMLRRITADLDHATKMSIVIASIIIFVFRATPGVGSGYQWFSIDVLKFDEEFFGILGQIGTLVGLVSLWLLSDAITRHSIVKVLLWLTVLGAILMLPNLALVHRVHEWTEPLLGIGARSIAVADTALGSPLAQVSMVPLLTLVAINAPTGHRAIWFALMASLMNLALVAGQLGTKYLNIIFPVERGAYGALPALTWTATLIGLLVPLVTIYALGRRLK